MIHTHTHAHTHVYTSVKFEVFQQVCVYVCVLHMKCEVLFNFVLIKYYHRSGTPVALI